MTNEQAGAAAAMLVANGCTDVCLTYAPEGEPGVLRSAVVRSGVLVGFVTADMAEAKKIEVEMGLVINT
jgi:hypothetical protein